MEHKEFDAIVTDIDEEQGIVKAIFAVMGNIDDGRPPDRIHPGAFTKTFVERGNQIMVLDNHRTDSVMSILGKPMGFRELGLGDLPAPLVDAYPDANGAAEAEIQFLLDTPEGKGAFTRIKAGALAKWSFGYDALDFDHETVKSGDTEIQVRNLRTIKLYELSPVLFAMNEATMTTGVKGDETESVTEPEPEDRPFISKAVNYDAITDQIRQAFYDQVQPRDQGMIAETPTDIWVRELWDEFVIASSGDGLWKIAYTVGDDDAVTFAPRDEWQQVEVQYVPVKNINSAPDADADQAAIEPNDDTKQAGPDTEPPTSEALDECNVLLAEILILSMEELTNDNLQGQAG